MILINQTNPERPGPIVHLIKHILSKETNKDLLKDIFRAAGRLGMAFLVDDLAEFIFYDDLELRKEAVTAMERIGTNKAVKRLEQIAQTDKCDSDVLDALAFLKGKRKTNATTSASPQPTTPHKCPCKKHVRLLASPNLEDRFKAFEYFSDKSAEVAEALHDNLNTQTPDLLGNLLMLIGRTIPEDSLGDLLALTEKKILKIRFVFVCIRPCHITLNLNPQHPF